LAELRTIKESHEQKEKDMQVQLEVINEQKQEAT